MKITVAIPTVAGRSQYLISCLKTCTVQDDDELEILVSDNSPGEARDTVASLNDPRVRYIQPPSYLPMSAHWDFVLTHVTGDMVTIIGDDDGLMPSCTHRVRDILAQIGEMPLQHSLGNYHWPDYIEPAKRNTVSFHHEVGCGQRVVASAKYLDQIAKGRSRYIDGPMIYHNFVPMSVMRTLMGTDGVCFRRASPDMYSALAVAAVAPQFCSTDQMLTISGQGARANGPAFARGNAASFSHEMNSAYAPRFSSRTVQLHVLDTLLEIARQHPGLESSIDFGAQFGSALLEALLMPRDRVAEIREIAGLARRHNVMADMVAFLVWGAVRRLCRGGRPAKAPGPVVFSKGEILAMPTGVHNIYTASCALMTMIEAVS